MKYWVSHNSNSLEWYHPLQGVDCGSADPLHGDLLCSWLWSSGLTDFGYPRWPIIQCIFRGPKWGMWQWGTLCCGSYLMELWEIVQIPTLINGSNRPPSKHENQKQCLSVSHGSASGLGPFGYSQMSFKIFPFTFHSNTNPSWILHTHEHLPSRLCHLLDSQDSPR